MTGIRDIESGKIYIGIEEPAKLDQAVETLNGDRPYDGTLVATGPSFLGAHKGGFAKATLNVGTALGDWSPGVSGRAVQVEGDVEIIGEEAENTVFIVGNVKIDGNGTSLDVIGNVSINGNLDSTDTVSAEVVTAPIKPFDIKHPSKEGWRLRYACIEGSEIAVYHRGRCTNTEIILPSYWKDLVYKDSITVQLTPIGLQQKIIVKKFDNEKVILESDTDKIDCFYMICGERKDVNPLVTEYKGDDCFDYPEYDYGQNTKTVL